MRWKLVAAIVICGVGFAACTGAPSSKAASNPSPLPAGWRRVSYLGVGIDVPGNWETWRLNCGATTPTVFVDADKPTTLDCADITITGPAQVVLAAPPGDCEELAKSEDINGLLTFVHARKEQEAFHGTFGGSATITTVEVWVPRSRLCITVSAAGTVKLPGGAPGRAEQIVQTIRQV